MRIITLISLLILAACGGVEGRIENAKDLEAQNGYISQIYQTGSFPIYSAGPQWQTRGEEVLTIVIEGDGYAWVGRSQVSGDPTPKNPVGLYIATTMQPQAIYLARPCQYVRTNRCHPRYWSTQRFAPEIITAYNDVLTQIKNKYGSAQTKFHLVGYSGGAYVALNMAAMRDDVEQVTTIAGLLSLPEWTDYHHITPLQSPATTDYLFQQSNKTRFTHICSGDDKVIPCDLARDILIKYDKMEKNHTIKALTGVDHGQIWKKAMDLMP